MRVVLVAVAVTVLVAVSGCSSDKPDEEGGGRFPGLVTTTSNAPVATEGTTTAASSTVGTAVPLPGMDDARALVSALVAPSGAGLSVAQADCVANGILRRITETSLPDILKMTRQQYPPGLADDLNAALAECLPDRILRKVVI